MKMNLTEIIERSEQIQRDIVPDNDTVRDLAKMVMYLALHVKQLEAKVKKVEGDVAEAFG
jgi:hypothetical protein